jgi:hypothetical protein
MRMDTLGSECWDRFPRPFGVTSQQVSDPKAGYGFAPVITEDRERIRPRCRAHVRSNSAQSSATVALHCTRILWPPNDSNSIDHSSGLRRIRCEQVEAGLVVFGARFGSRSVIPSAVVSGPHNPAAADAPSCRCHIVAPTRQRCSRMVPAIASAADSYCATGSTAAGAVQPVQERGVCRRVIMPSPVYDCITLSVSASVRRASLPETESPRNRGALLGALLAPTTHVRWKTVAGFQRLFEDAS